MDARLRRVQQLSALLLIFAVVLAGCGGPTAAPGGGGATTDNAEPIKIGVILPYSGVYSALGEDITNGMKLYFESQGNTIAGRPIQLIQEDTEADPQVGVQRARALIEREEVDILAGAVSTAVAYGVIDLVEREDKVFVIANATGNNATRRGVKQVFRVSASSWQVSHPMGAWLVDQGTTEALVSAADYAAGHEMVDGFKTGFTAAGGSIVDEVFAPLGTNDFSSFLTRIRQSNAPAVWCFYAGSDAVRFVQQYESYGVEAPLFGPGYLAEADTIGAQQESAEGVRTALHYALTLDNPQNQEFIAKYREAYNEEPSVYAMQGWDAAWLIGEALKATNGNTDDTAALIAAMEQVEFNSPRGPLTLDENHNPIQNIYIREVQKQADGSLQNVVIDTIENVQDPGQ